MPNHRNSGRDDADRNQNNPSDGTYFSPVSRRETLAAVLGVSGLGLGYWTTSGAAEPASTQGDRAVPQAIDPRDNVAFFDDFNDGDYTTSPAWQITRDAETYSAQVVDQPSPRQEGGRDNTLIESFEDEDLSEYDGNRTDDGRLGWTTTPEISSQGDLSLTRTVGNESFDTVNFLFQSDPVIERGTEYAIDYYLDTQNGDDRRFHDPHFLFAVQDSENYYDCSINNGGTDFNLAKIKDGSAVIGSSSASGGRTNQWDTLRVAFGDDGTITCSISDASVSITDDEYDTGGYGFLSTGRAMRNYWDNLRDPDKALSVSETQSDATAGNINWAQGVSGWSGPWTLSGSFYTKEIDTTRPAQTHAVNLYRTPDGTATGLSLNLGFTQGNGDARLFSIFGELVDSIEETRKVGWKADTWYNYEVSHDGNGKYTGRLWTTGESRPAEPQAISSGTPPGSAERVAGIDINGAEGVPFEIRHDYMRFETAGKSLPEAVNPTPPLTINNPANDTDLNINIGNRSSIDWEIAGTETLFLEFFAIQEATADVRTSFDSGEVIDGFPSSGNPGEEYTAKVKFDLREGAVQVERTVRVDISRPAFTMRYSITNISDSRIESVKLYQYCDFDIGTAGSGDNNPEYDDDTGQYLQNSDIIKVGDATGNPVPVAGFRGDKRSQDHHIDDYPTLSNIRRGVLNSEDLSINSDPVVAQEWEVGDLRPGESETIEIRFGAARTNSELKALLTPLQFRSLIEDKRNRIEDIRSQGDSLIDRFDLDLSEPLDKEAEEFLNTLDLSEITEELDTYEQALEQLLSAESVTERALKEFAKPIGEGDKVLVEQYVNVVGKALLSQGLGIALGEVGDLVQYGDLYRNLVRDVEKESKRIVNRIAGEELAIEYETIARQSEAFDNQFVSADLKDSYEDILNDNLSVPEDLPKIDLYDEIEKDVIDEAGRRTMRSVLSEPEPVEASEPAVVGGYSETLPDLPDSIKIPFAEETEDATNFVGGLVEAAADEAGGVSDEIKELPEYRIKSLENTELSFSEIPIPFDIPDELNIPERRFDQSEFLEDLFDTFDWTTQGIDTELKNDVERLINDINNGTLPNQADGQRRQFAEKIRDLLESLFDFADEVWVFYESFLNNWAEISEKLAGIFALVVVASLANTLQQGGLSFVVIPLLAGIVEAIGIVGATILAAIGVTGYGFINALTRTHSHGVDTILTEDLSKVPDIL